ncbi:hypothetical protein L6164_006597 [Bauhinia variegata]|uniref:Uncharacterized protein n=1 Tax=Bauhinia variegata TaxID=167791 RepID=A0ACB9PU55_BAUVA|nr:hypothetical protein L6164_006597 [Bauhinia variegata]
MVLVKLSKINIETTFDGFINWPCLIDAHFFSSETVTEQLPIGVLEMDSGGADHEASASLGGVNENSEGVSSSGEVIGDLGTASTMLTRLELFLECCSEKIVNLSLFMLNLETLESEFAEAYAMEKDYMGTDCTEKGMEFDLLSGIFDAEITELDSLLVTLKHDITDLRERISSCKHLGETFMAMQEKLSGSERYLKQSEEQFAEIKMQSANFQRASSCFKRVENSGSGEEGAIMREDDEKQNLNAEIKMQTTEQQRRILRMLEKSLASEMDLEKNLNDSRQIEGELKLRILSLEEELVHMEEEATDFWGKWVEADNTNEVLFGISRDLLGRLQITQFNLNGLSKRESELRAKLEEYEFQLKNAKSSAYASHEKYNVLCSEVRSKNNLTEQLKEHVSEAESRATTAEAQCKQLRETNAELIQELAVLNDGASERVDSLKKQLKESAVQLQHALASEEASQEKQSMLYSTIRDMENVIMDLKSKVSKAENLADSAEEKCIILSESNAELNEELSFLRNRLECLEGSLHQMEEAKVATAKDIGLRTKGFKNLVTQLAFERERLSKQISSLAIENKILVVKLKQTYKAPCLGTNGFSGDSGFSAKEIKVSETSPTGHEVDGASKNFSASDNEEKFADSKPDVGTVRRIDVGVLNVKNLLIAVLVLLVSAVAYLFQQQKF